MRFVSNSPKWGFFSFMLVAKLGIYLDELLLEGDVNRSSQDVFGREKTNFLSHTLLLDIQKT
jgi:hypothetical protein